MRPWEHAPLQPATISSRPKLSASQTGKEAVLRASRVARIAELSLTSTIPSALPTPAAGALETVVGLHRNSRLEMLGACDPPRNVPDAAGKRSSANRAAGADIRRFV